MTSYVIALSNMEPQISIRDVLRWIVENCDDKEAMTKISTMAYPFSSKFQERYPTGCRFVMKMMRATKRTVVSLSTRNPHITAVPHSRAGGNIVTQTGIVTSIFLCYKSVCHTNNKPVVARARDGELSQDCRRSVSLSPFL